MGIENFKRWHWCVIGLLVGAVVASLRIWSGPGEPTGAKHVRPRVFEEQLFGGRDVSHRRVYKLEHFVLHPPEELPLPGGIAKAEYVTYDAWMQTAEDPNQMEKVPQYLVLELRSFNDKSAAGDLTNLGFREYFDRLNAQIEKLNAGRTKKIETIAYRFNWIETPKGAYSVFPLGGLVVIGLIWPTIVNFLAGAGFGRGVKEDDEYDLARFKGGAEPSKAAKAVVTKNEMDQLDELEAELEARLKEGATDRADAPAEAPKAPAPVKVLNAGPVEAPKEAVKKEVKQKGFGADQGDYYPTEVHGKKP